MYIYYGVCKMGELGKRIKKARAALNITQDELAQKLGSARATVASWEIGRRDPDTETLNKISDICKVSVDWLLGKEKVTEIDIVDMLENKTANITAAGRPLTSEERLQILQIIDKSHVELSKLAHVAEGNIEYAKRGRAFQSIGKTDTDTNTQLLNKNIPDSARPPRKQSDNDVSYDVDAELDRAVLVASHQGREEMRPLPPGLRDLIKQHVIEILEEERRERQKNKDSKGDD
jgi:transcriptional regulator with XRE-family HTH domain